MEKIKIKLLRNTSKSPTYGSELAAGADIYADITENIVILPHQTVMIPSGFAIEIPAGFGGFIYPRSGMASKRGLAPANKVGVIDSDYRGEVIVALHNHGEKSETVSPEERIAQLIIAPVFTPGFEVCDELSDTSRGEGGFGSTGTK